MLGTRRFNTRWHCYTFIDFILQLWSEMGLLVGEPVKEKYQKAMDTALKKVADATGCALGVYYFRIDNIYVSFDVLACRSWGAA